MTPGFQSSFIPKEPETGEVFKKKKAGLFGMVAVLLFASAIVLSIALFIYRGMLKSDITALQTELVLTEKSIDKKTINEMSQFSKRLRLTQSIILKHQVISGFLEALSNETVSSVYFTDFSYTNTAEDNISVAMRGKASGYAAVALQESVFKKNKNFKSVVFSNLTLADGGLVSFDLNIALDPKISVYSLETVPVSTPTSTSTATTTKSSTSIKDIDDELDNLSDLDDISSDLDNL